MLRYMIPRYTDVEQFFSINSEDGMITTTRPLDRETQAWHNISVSATEIGRCTRSPQSQADSKRIGKAKKKYLWLITVWPRHASL